MNSIPSRVRFTLDLRDIDGANRDIVLAEIGKAAEEVATRREVAFEWKVLNADPPALAAEQIVTAVSSAAASLGLDCQKMISRAYHDSLFMARISPMGMIFIPCRGGVSHRFDEYSSPEQIEAGVTALCLTLAELSS